MHKIANLGIIVNFYSQFLYLHHVVLLDMGYERIAFQGCILHWSSSLAILIFLYYGEFVKTSLVFGQIVYSNHTLSNAY